jgi:pimeloyl-ACP methyl ester carboxylesterase
VTPRCTVCGYAVEVVRSCFSSKWRLFRNNPTSTAGTYIFCDDDTPVYPGWHNFWSRDWISDELDGAQLGEDPSAVRSYSLGAPLGTVPGGALIGSADCVANGDTWPVASPPVLVGGFDVRCPELIAAPRVTLDPTDPENWCFWAEVVNQTYVNATVQLARVAAAYDSPVRGYAQDTNNGLQPKHFAFLPPPPLPAVLVLAGTDSALQWIAQVTFGVGAPFPFGTFSTNPIWMVTSSQILDRLVPFAVPVTQPLVIVGHSMGGAVGSILAARFRQAHPGRKIEVLTFGSPRPGNAQLHSILFTCRIATVVNEGDPVAGLPTNFDELPVLLKPILALRYPPGSTNWFPAPNRYRVAWDGTIGEGAAQPGPAEAALQVLLWAFTAGNFPDLSAHLPDEYERRLCRPAPLPTAWFDSWDVARAYGNAVAVWPNSVDPTNSAAAAAGFGEPTYSAPAQGMLSGLVFGGAPTVNDLLEIPTPLVGSPGFAIYAVFQIVYPSPNYDNSYRHSVPIESVSLHASVATRWGGSAFLPSGWTLGQGIGSINLPCDGGVYGPILLSIVWDGTALTVTLENYITNTGTQTLASFSPGWNFIGGEIPGTTFTYCSPQRIGEIVFYASALSSPDDSSVREYLRSKWLMNGVGLATEAGDLIATEAGSVLVTEGETYGIHVE